MTVFHSCARRVAQVVASYQVAAISALVVAILVGTLSTDFSASTSRRFLVAEGSCDSAPSWPDCAEMSCSSGSWTCTKMKEGSSSSYGTYNSSSYSSYGEYHSAGSAGSYGSYNSAGSAGSYYSSMPCQGSPPNNDYANYWCDYNTGVWKSSGGGSSTSWSGGGCTGTPPPNSWCEGGVWKSSGGGSGPGCPTSQRFTTQAECSAYCVANNMMGAGTTTAMCDPICGDLDPCGGGSYGTTGGYGSTGGYGGQGGGVGGCFYPDATINGAKAGFTVWCKEHYNDCYEGISSGTPVSNAGLSLGAPSWCESWEKGQYSGGAGGGSDGGFSGGGGITCCLPTPECKPGTPCPMYMPSCTTVLPGQNPPAGYTCGGNTYGGGGGYGDHGDYGFDGGIGDYMGDFAGYGGRPGPGEDDQARFVDEKKRQLKDFSHRIRAVKDMERSLRDSRVENATLKSQIEQFKSLLSTVQVCKEKATNWDEMGACGDQEMALSDLEREIWDALQASNIVKDLENQKREWKNMEREIARLEREDKETAVLNQLLERIKSIHAEVVALAQTDPQEAQYRMQDIWDSQQEFWSEVQGLQQEEHMKEFEMHLNNACRDLKREVSRLPKESRKNGEDILQRCDALVAQVRVDMQNTDDPFAVGEDFRWAIEDLWRELHESMNVVWQENDCRDAERGLAEAGRAIHEEAPRIIDEVDNPAIANRMEELLEEAQDIWGEGVSEMEDGNCEGAMDVVDMLHENIASQFDDLMRDAGVDYEDFEGGEFDHRFVDFDSRYRDFYDEGGFGEFDIDFDTFDNYLEENEYDMSTLSLAKKIAGSILAEYLKGQQGVGGGTDLLSVASELNIDTLALQKLMDANNQLLAVIENLKAQVTSLKGELARLADEVAAYTFAPEVQDKVEDFIADLPNLTTTEAEEQLDNLKDESQEAYVEAGLTPYEDIFPFEGHDWFVGPVADMTKAGLFEGVGDGNFAPDEVANVAAVVTTFARALEVDESGAEPVSDLAGEMPEWAEEPAAGLEEVLADQGEDLSSVFEGSPGDAVTRLEVARLVDAVYADSFDETSAGTEVLGGYTDLDGLSVEDLEAVATVVSAGIMTGTDHEWNPDEGFNRAQFATVMDRLAEATGEFGHEEDGYDDEGEDTGGSDFGEQDEETYQYDEEEIEFHSAGEEEFDTTTEEAVSSEEEVQAPAYYYDSMVTKAQLSEVQEGVVYYQAQHKTISEYTSTIKDVAEILTGMAKKFEPYAGVPTWKLNICNEFVGKETEVLRMIMSELGRPINC